MFAFQERSRSGDNSGSLRDTDPAHQPSKSARLATQGHSWRRAFRFRTRVRFPPPPLTTNLGGASGRPRLPPPRVARSDRGLCGSPPSPACESARLSECSRPPGFPPFRDGWITSFANRSHRSFRTRPLDDAQRRDFLWVRTIRRRPAGDTRLDSRFAEGRTHMRLFIGSSFAVLLLLVTSQAAFAQRCDPTGADAAAIAAARAAADAACDCNTPDQTHGQYVSCAVQAINASGLRMQCRGVVKKCYSRSTCGKPGFVTCC